MTKRNSTKRALMASILSVVLCLSMLVGSTFAWFTDSASTGVNKIVSGTLDIGMMMNYGNSWEDAENKKLEFRNKNGSADILWEPGCTFTLPAVKLVNKGNLAFKYNVAINSIDAEGMKLAEVLEVILNGNALVNPFTQAPVTLKDGLENPNLLAMAFFGTTVGTLLPKEETPEFTLALHMAEEAGNEYQGLAIDGLGLTVFATQYTHEYDSSVNTYDKDAYYHEASVNGITYKTFAEAIAAAQSGDTLSLNNNVTYDLNTAGGKAGKAIPSNATFDWKNVTVEGNGYKLTITGDGSNNTIANATLKNLTVIDETESYAESSWELGYLEMSNITAVDTVFLNGIMLDGACSFERCTFTGKTDDGLKMYGVWVNSGSASFTECLFVGTRGLKVHEAYETDVASVTVSGCTFDNLTEKPAVALGTLNADTAITIKDSAVINCQPGDQGLYLYESDTDVSAFTFVNQNNSYSYVISSGDELKDIITDAKDPTTVELPSGEYTLPSVAGKDITISGTKDTVIDVTKLPNTTGTTLTFEGVTVEFANENYKGFSHSDKVVYKDAHIVGKQFLYSDTEFINCTFENKADYCVWTYGAKNVTFTGCTFNTGGKAVLVYNEMKNASFVANVSFTNCVFNDDDTLTTSKAAVETGVADFSDPTNNSSPALNTPTSNKYNITFTGCTVNGFVESPEGLPTGSKLFANKNSMDQDHLNVVINGTEVY